MLKFSDPAERISPSVLPRGRPERSAGLTGEVSRVAVPRRELEAFRLGSRQGWERCIESLKDYRGDGLVTDDMVAWLEKEMKEDCG